MDVGSVRVLFMGTSRFAVPSLESLVREGYQVVGVFTQPPRPAGRGKKLTPSPVMEAAERLRIPVRTPERLAAPEAVAAVESLRPDLVVVAAYAQFLPRAVLGLPRHGCVNVHASLLPRWRGASPIHAAILAGDEFTGVTIMVMEPAMDTGPILGQIVTRVDDADTTPDLEERLSRGGAAMLASVLPCYLAGLVEPVPQGSEGVTYAPIIKREDGLIDWSWPAERIWRASRAFRSWPGAYTFWGGKMVKIAACRPDPGATATAEVGTVLALPGKRVAVATGEGVLLLEEVAPEGGRTMMVQEFVVGHRSFVGSRLGGPSG